MISMQIMLGQLTGNPVQFPTRVGRVFISDKEVVKFRGPSDAYLEAAKRKSREQFGKARATILTMEGEFNRTMLKN